MEIKTIHAEHGKPLNLGREGENNARQVLFDLSHWRMIYGPGTAQLIAQRTGETTPYPAALTVAGNTATWVITAADTAIHGEWGKAELRYMVGDTLAKSETWRTIVWDALGEPSETPPEVHQGWMDRVLAAGAQAQAAAAQAQAYADRAAELATKMTTLAEQISQDATAAAQAKTDALAAQGKAETAQQAAETARQAAEDAANTTGANVTAAAAAATRAENAASQAATALADIQALYQALQEYAAQVVQTIRTEGQAQLEQIAAEGTQAKSDIEEIKGAAITAIGETTNTSITAIQKEGATQTANATEQAKAAAASNEEVQAAKTDIQDSIDGAAQEQTAQNIETLLEQINALLLQIAEQGGDAGSLNGFSFALGESGEVLLSYTDPETGTLQDTVTLPTDTTLTEIQSAVADISSNLKIIVEGGET